ncbi:TerB family tellurite resistance protein [Maribellus luteus]|uniref:TerB family tellurite resistance protein n=1 Tax=Maribellus luteus TaxID=2305463 RepID=A0A399SU93_9BACT|nr:TerB family tellurite resistance protein [Maribellus luteus]RIJ46314.1 TerB family tellurite resistance protein [Maribellus luteus]
MELLYTTFEKMAMAKFLIEILKADDNIDPNETGYLFHLQKVLYITDSEVSDSSLLSHKEAISIIRDMSHINKMAFVHIMTQMVHSDGHVDGRESAIMMDIMFEADLPFN